jgi:hypothetical protein
MYPNCIKDFFKKKKQLSGAGQLRMRFDLEKKKESSKIFNDDKHITPL